jgi:Ca2+-binding RTX toxin-like protein
MMILGALALFLTAGVASAAGIYGTYDDEYVVGTSSNDFISAGLGNDEIYGYEGDDVIYAADALYSEYDAVDSISCGEGYDIAVVDSYDTVASDCEVSEYDLTVYPTG